MKRDNGIKICMIVSNSLKKDPRVQREARSAHESGFEVVFIGIEDRFYDEEFLKTIPYRCEIINYPLWIRESKNLLIRALRMFYRDLSYVIKIIKSRPKIVHCNDLDMLMQGIIGAKICRARVVYDSHELNCDIANLNPSKKEKSQIALERSLLKHVDSVISVSNSAAKVLSEFYSITPTVVTNCSFLSDIDLNQIRKNKVFSVVYQGIMSEDRGYEEFVLSAKYLNDNIVLVLRGYGKIKEKLLEIVKENQLEKRVIFEDPCEISELIVKAAESHVGVVLTKPVNSNFKYTVGNKLFEYLNAGIPVILSNVPEHVLLNGIFKFGVTLDVTPVQIAKEINLLACDNERYETFKENAITTSKIMCWENEVEKLLDVYRNLL